LELPIHVVQIKGFWINFATIHLTGCEFQIPQNARRLSNV
jgi:hypothetical protein